MTPPSDTAADKNQRFAAYLEHMNQLKEGRVTLREVLEREILLGFIRTNRSSINEFPLLETQQQSVIEFMCQRLDHPAYDYIKKLSGNFIALLGHYRKAVQNKDKELQEKTTTLLYNTEILLIKCMQGIVYSVGLITDNLEELIIRLYGKKGMSEFSAMLKSSHMDSLFWKKFMDHFVSTPVAKGHENILNAQLFAMSKQGQMLVVRYPMDEITKQITPADAKLEKTRIQKTFEATIRDPEVRSTLKLVHNSLSKNLAFIPAELLSKNDIGFIARIGCIDSASNEFHDAYQEKVQNKDTNPDQEHGKLKFLMDQVTAVGVGATIGASMTRQNLEAALMSLVPGTLEAFSAMGRNFRFDNIKKMLLGLLEDHFILRLHEQAGDDLSKIKLMKSRTRRALAAEVSSIGLSKIRLNKLFETDPTDKSQLLFRPRNNNELAGLVKLLQLEPKPAQKIVTLWQAENIKTEVLLLIDLAQLQRTTTNIQARIQEMLKNFGLVKVAKNDTAAQEPNQEQPATPSQ